MALGDDLRDVVPPPRTQLGGVGVIYSVIEYPLFEFAAVCTILKATPDQRNARSRHQPPLRMFMPRRRVSIWLCRFRAFSACFRNIVSLLSTVLLFPLFSCPTSWTSSSSTSLTLSALRQPPPLVSCPLLMSEAFITAKHSCQLKVHDRPDLVAIPTYCLCNGPTLRGIPADYMVYARG